MSLWFSAMRDPAAARVGFSQKAKVALVPCLISVAGGSDMGFCNPDPFTGVIMYRVRAASVQLTAIRLLRNG